MSVISPQNASPAPATQTVLKTAGRTTLLAIVFVLLSRVLGVVRSMVIAHIFGQNPVTDIYNRAFAVPDLLYLLMAGGALSTVFVPVFTEYMSARDEKGAWKTFGLIVTMVAVVSVILVSIAEILAYPLSRMVAPQFTEDGVRGMVPLTRILLPAQIAFFVGGLFVAVLQFRDRWLIPNVAPLVYNGGIILGALLFGRQFGTAAMAWGALLGAFLGNLLLPAWDLHRSGVRWSPGWDLQNPGVRKFGELLLPAMLGLGLSQLGFWLGGYFVGEGSGHYTALKNGFELTQAPIGIFAQASAIVLFPTISRLAAAQDWSPFAHEIHHGLRRILFLTVPASLLLAVLAEPVITLLYAGKKFGPSQIADAALALRLYALGTFAWSAQAIVSRGFFALKDTKTPLNITKFMIVLLAGLYVLFFYGWHFSFGGIAAAFSVVGTLNMVLVLTTLSRRVATLSGMGGLNLRALIIASLRIFAAALPSALVAGLANHYLTLLFAPNNGVLSRPASAGVLALAGGLGLLAYLVLSVLLRVPELKTVRALFRPANRPR